MLNTTMAYSIHDIHRKKLVRPNEAQQIEVARRRLLLQSEEIRIGNSHLPNLTALRLARSALLLANSGASMFEKIHTLNAAHANLRAGNLSQLSMRTIAGLSQQALKDAYPPTNHREIDELNRIDVLARRRAIEHTTPTTPFIVALNEARTYFGYPVDPPKEDKASRQATQSQDFATGEHTDFTEDHTESLFTFK